LVTYLNTTPLASRPGYGEVIGIPEALWVWYGTDLATANQVLTQPALDPAGPHPPRRDLSPGSESDPAGTSPGLFADAKPRRPHGADQCHAE
jgi:hypothetical protein